MSQAQLAGFLTVLTISLLYIQLGEIYSTVHCHLTRNLNSQKSKFETTHLKHFIPNNFVINTIFKPVKLSNKLKPFRLGLYKTIQYLSDNTHELMTQGGSTFHTHRKHILQKKLSQGTYYCTISPSKPFYSLTF